MLHISSVWSTSHTVPQLSVHNLRAAVKHDIVIVILRQACMHEWIVYLSSKVSQCSMVCQDIPVAD